MRRRYRPGIHTALHDFAFLTKVMSVLFLVILIQFINPITEEVASKSPVAGDLAVEIHWPDKMDADVDLWVQGPRDVAPVGYSRRSDQQFSYLRDDIGNLNDATGKNYEFSFARGLGEGIYIVNIHLYNYNHPGTVPVKVVITLSNGPKKRELAVVDLIMQSEGQEKTAVVFEMTRDGTPFNVQSLPDTIPLRTRSWN